MDVTIQCLTVDENDNDSPMYDGFLPTEYIEDGEVYEYEYSESQMIHKLLTGSYLEVMALIGQITKFTKDAYKKTIDDSATGLTEKSIVRRWNRKQYALANAIMQYIKSLNIKLYRRLFRDDQPLWNLLFAVTITEFDKVLAENENQ